MAKYFLHNGVEGETEFYDSWEELQKAYEDLRSQYLDMDDGWDEEITAICAGEVTHRATMTDIQYPPKRENFKSEEAYQIAVEEYGIDVDDYAYKCDYKLLPLTISSMPTGKSLIDSKNQEEIENIKGNSRMKILNLTQHKATPEQIEQGVIELDEDTKEWVKDVLTFDTLPSTEELIGRAEELATVAAMYDVADDDYSEEYCKKAMIGGAPFFMPFLEEALVRHLVQPVHAFSKRESMEKTMSDDTVQKVAVFKHVGFVEAVEVFNFNK